MPTAASAWFNQANDQSGLITFATVLYMFLNDMYQIVDAHPRHWVRIMIYLDATAFVVSYAGVCARDQMPLCSQRNGVALVADLVWCAKDAVKYGYVSYRALTICGYKFKLLMPACRVVGLISAVLYSILIYQGYSLTEPTCLPHFESTLPRVALYLYWTLIDILSAGVIILKMRRAIKESRNLLGCETPDARAFSILRFREEMHLILVSISMMAVTVVSVVDTTAVESAVASFRVGTMVFVFCQLSLLLGSRKVVAVDTASLVQNRAQRASSVPKLVGTIVISRMSPAPDSGTRSSSDAAAASRMHTHTIRTSYRSAHRSMRSLAGGQSNSGDKNNSSGIPSVPDSPQAVSRKSSKPGTPRPISGNHRSWLE
ncbi:hypothetical protein HDU98_010568 [Podochytrium sp. JEL0797]|nr:hypothetical protein HDU98_010568 [Podochytrium sp. JEL0797]